MVMDIYKGELENMNNLHNKDILSALTGHFGILSDSVLLISINEFIFMNCYKSNEPCIKNFSIFNFFYSKYVTFHLF